MKSRVRLYVVESTSFPKSRFVRNKLLGLLMKRSALQCAVGFIGATLIVVGVVWTCRQLSSPNQLNAAQDSSVNVSSNAQAVRRQKPTGSLSLSVSDSNSERPISQRYDSEQPADLPRERKIRSTSGSDLNLSVVEEAPSTIDAGDFPSASELDPLSEADSFITTSNENDVPNIAELDSPMQDDFSSAQAPLSSFPSPTVSQSDSEFATLKNNAEAPSEQPDSSLVISQVGQSYNDFPTQEQPAAIEPLNEEAFTPSDDSVARLDSLSEANVPNAAPIAVQEPQVLPAQTIPQTTQIPSIENDQENAPRATPTEMRNVNPQSAPERLANFSATPQNVAANNAGTLVDSLLQFVQVDAAASPAPDDKFSGVQTTHIVVEKQAPEEISLNNPVTIVVVVKNQGLKEVQNLVLRDSIPEGTKFESCVANIVPNAQGELIWPKFNLQPQSEKKFEYAIVPLREGSIGSVASVLIVASASVQTTCTRPELKVEVSAPEEVEIGQNVNFDIVVTNVGTGVANNIMLQETIPQGLYHPSGSVLNNGLGKLNAGESKRLPLSLRSSAAGVVVNRLTITADDCEPQSIDTQVTITSPQLELSIAGPENVYLERSAAYQLGIKNVGNAAAYDVKLIAKLPEGTDFISANNLGAYRENERAVYWDLAELPAQMDAVVELSVKTNKAAQSELAFSASGPNNLTAQASHSVTIDGLAALSFNVTSSTDLVEVGKEYEYAIQIENRGTKASNNVVLQILPPEAISILATDGPTKATEQNGVVVFGKIATIPPKSNVTFKIKATPSVAGDCRVGFQLSSDDLEPLTKEENTRVYQ